MAEITDSQKCKRSDGIGWRCSRPVAESSEDVSVSDVTEKRGNRVKLESGEPVVVDLKMGRLENAPAGKVVFHT
ncbi:putative transcription factor interactor and regulator C3H-WRC/GRF family [Helianthus annuus]|nr:putative transcription factor interactor and regulator C3H-WRC/GRF family [Helianthus annuus]